jgi:hypothetical protein
MPWQGSSVRTALEAGTHRDHSSGVGVLMPAAGPGRESIGSPNRAESLVDLGSSTLRRRTMALQRSTLGQRALFAPDLVRVLVVAAAVIVLMIVLTVVFGVQQNPPSYQIVPDPASGLGLPF